MSFRIFLAGTLLAAGLPAANHAHATQPPELAGIALQASSSSGQSRYELGAVVDVRRASVNGVTILAITPGGAADRMGLQTGDQLRVVNGRRLDGTTKPSSTLENALQEGNGALQVEAMRNGKPLMLAGRADIASTLPPKLQGGRQSCGYVSARAGVVPRSQDIFHADITQVDGRSTPVLSEYRHRLDAGKHVLVVREFIDPKRLNSSQLQQIAKMKKFAFARAYKSLVVDVQPGTSHRIGVRLLRDKLDTQSIRDNAYWEPVVWQEVAEACP